MTIPEVCRLAKEGAHTIAYSTEEEKNKMLTLAADALIKDSAKIIAENHEDVISCTRGAQFQDRLMLNEQRIAGIAEGLKKLIALPCPVGEVIERHTAASGIVIERVRVPFGVIGIVYESRPNVTADAIGLCIKSGNAVVLRGSKDALRSNIAIVTSIKEALKAGGFDPSFIQLITDKTREGAREFMRQKGLIDVLIPRGSKTLIDSALENATVPVIETGTGNCHIYLEQSADINKAIPILINAKTQRTSVCNAVT